MPAQLKTLLKSRTLIHIKQCVNFIITRRIALSKSIDDINAALTVIDTRIEKELREKQQEFIALFRKEGIVDAGIKSCLEDYKASYRNAILRGLAKEYRKAEQKKKSKLQEKDPPFCFG